VTRGETRDAAAFFDAYGGREWARLEDSVHGRAKYAIHRKLLDDSIASGMRVLDAGCGPGRFAIDMAVRGARVTLLDISPGQLSLARTRVTAAGVAVEAYVEGDVRDLSRFDSASFDAVVAFGGAVSYAYDGHRAALAELVRVCRPGGALLLSVMSLWGSLMLAGTLDAEAFLREMEDHLPWLPEMPPPRDGVLLTVPSSNEFHLPMALFSSAGLRAALESEGCSVQRMAAANPVSRAGLPLAHIGASEAAERRLIALETALCEVPGLVDAGEHLVAVARTPA
jgi:2-polyprenyl-3-methyl-5-hydroxy-6-metoxy-1,4-benzoquinol methylase